MSVLIDIASKHGVDTIALLSYEDLRRSSTIFPFYLAVKVNPLQLNLNHLQEAGLYSIDDNFDY